MKDSNNTQSAIIADHIIQVYFGGNWTAVNLKDTLMGISWEVAAKKVEVCHSIAELVFHMNYFVTVLLKVLHGHPLQGNDAESFDCPPINSQADWETLQKRVYAEVEEFAVLVAAIPEQQLWELVGDAKYGTYYRNLHGIIEHCHYHLGQIVLLKKILFSTT